MEENKESDKIILPHHKQQSLCTTRLPYRQGRKLTAVKVYSITKESNHLLIFGVPSLNLRQETKSLFAKFGKLFQFNISTRHATEPFTETYHAQYEKTQPARIAKKMLDTKNFYGGILHVCYAPEFETVEETRQKLIQRQRDVLFRLKNLNKEVKNEPELPIICPNVQSESKKLNMGVVNTIRFGEACELKRKKNKKFKTNSEERFVKNHENTANDCNETNKPSLVSNLIKNNEKIVENLVETNKGFVSNLIENSKDIEVVDCTDVNSEVVTNIHESLNYNKFGTEVVKKIPEKPLNKIRFYLNKQS